MAHNRTDLDTIDIVLQTELEEVEEALRLLKRYGNGGTAPIRDQNLALLQWRRELRWRRVTQHGLRAAIQLSRESRSDQAAILRDIRNREVDEAPAARVAPPGHAPSPQQAPPGTLDVIPVPDAQAQVHQREDFTTIPAAPPPVVLRECIACSESRPESDTIQNSCSHVYCQGCVIRLLQNALADESLFPLVVAGNLCHWKVRVVSSMMSCGRDSRKKRSNMEIDIVLIAQILLALDTFCQHMSMVQSQPAECAIGKLVPSARRSTIKDNVLTTAQRS
ncbi:uncharacterized protein N7525_001457 [Penicillium rubens]|uniref:uncharacterized protein n=1 Tax=Penicillium rubens TaxID=1108849 RepID=UPI002A5A3DD6|nr:uncharacterized protein N7525_001457 [Penicillium rubens]KAJ5843716.1 hypothetical protein N7525_001457 [Penicillium rubens]